MLARGTLIVVAGLVIGFSMSCLLVETSQAANECMLKPNGTAPQGTHWYYHLERATQRKCWYLGAEGTREQVRGLQPAAKTHRAASKPVAQTAAQAPAEFTTAAAEDNIAAPNANAAQDAMTASLSTRWSGFPRSPVSAEPPPASTSSSYAQEQAAATSEDDMPLIWPILTPAELSQTEPVPQASTSLWQLTAAFAAVLALAALIAHLLLRLTAARKNTAARRNTRVGVRERPSPQSRTTMVQRRLRATSDHAAETEASVRRLLHDLQHRRDMSSAGAGL